MAKRKLADDAGDTHQSLRRSTRRKPISDAAPRPGQHNSLSANLPKELSSQKAFGRIEKHTASQDDILHRQFWLLKAEPESRFENGVDVKFSIDDLAAKTEPEPWDGIRNYAARNNLRAMRKGDLAFFYHSNCKVPGIVGTMEVVEEHSPDCKFSIGEVANLSHHLHFRVYFLTPIVTAHDPNAPYYDPKSKLSDPKWSVVHVEFRTKFTNPITLVELREMGQVGKPLEHMQMLKQTRLSVSRVDKGEWEYLIRLVEDKSK